MDNVQELKFDASRIAAARGGRSLQEIAEQVGISRQALWQIETGRNMPSADVLVRLCSVLDLEIRDLTGDFFSDPCKV